MSRRELNAAVAGLCLLVALIAVGWAQAGGWPRGGLAGSPGGSTVTLTSTQVAFGDGSNAVSGEAAFTYDATNNILTADNVRVGNGSAGTPNISFSSDTNTGIFRVAEDNLGFTTGGSERWRVRSTGQLVPIAATYTFGDNSARTNSVWYTTGDSSGSPGNATSNTGKGRFAIAAAGTTATITNSLATAASSCIATANSNDATCWVKSCVPASGSLVVTMNAACTGATTVDFVLFP